MIAGRDRKLKKRSMSPSLCQPKEWSQSQPTYPIAVLPDQHTGCTKKEQHGKFVDYDKNVVHHVPDRVGTFRRQHHLSDVHTLQDHPLHNLQTYRILFDQIIRSSSLYGEALQEIKAMYDMYLWQIIESVPLQPQEPVHLYQSEDIERLRISVNKLESGVTSLVAENARLQEVLKEETENYATAKANLEAPVVVPREESSEAIEFSDKVEKLQLKIVKQRLLTQSYLDQRVGKVPISVVRNLEHALKETEISIQKLDKHSLFLETRIKEMNKQLEILLSSSQKAKAARRKWLVVASKLQEASN
ncbi:uncharacterized protein C6orf118-like isoform X2 [Dysidea avara]